jgi:hypothetical protein
MKACCRANRESGKTRCAECLQKLAVNNRERRAKRVQAGACVEFGCVREVLKDRTRCYVHELVHVQRMRRARRKRSIASVLADKLRERERA